MWMWMNALKLNFNASDQQLTAVINENFQLIRSLLKIGMENFMPEAKPFVEAEARLEEFIHAQIKMNIIKHTNPKMQFYMIVNSNPQEKKKWKTQANLLNELNYTPNKYTGHRPNFVIWTPLSPTTLKDPSKTGFVENLQGRKVLIEGSTITPGNCEQCGSPTKLQQVGKIDSDLFGFYFILCERVITSSPLTLCGYHAYIKAPIHHS